MYTRIALSISALMLIGCTAQAPVVTAPTPTTEMEHMDHGDDMAEMQHELSDSPRHQEWVTVDNNGKQIQVFVVYPETSEKVPVVLVIHENKGLNDWAKGMADQIAEAGYIAIAPDLLSEYSDTQQQTSDFATPEDATKAIGTLDPAQVDSDLGAVMAYANTIPASNGKIASAGFCWGGARSFALATTRDDLDAALVFYGTAPTDTTTFDAIEAPVYGFYGGDDARVNATIPETETAMQNAGKTYEYITYDGAGHAFMRSGEDADGEPANIQARTEAWERMKTILADL